MKFTSLSEKALNKFLNHIPNPKIARQTRKRLKMTPNGKKSKSQKTKNLTKSKISFYMTELNPVKLKGPHPNPTGHELNTSISYSHEYWLFRMNSTLCFVGSIFAMGSSFQSGMSLLNAVNILMKSDCTVFSMVVTVSLAQSE